MLILERAVQDYCFCPRLLHNSQNLSRYQWQYSCRNTWIDLQAIIEKEDSNSFGYGEDQDWGIEIKSSDKFGFGLPASIGHVAFRLKLSRIQMNLDSNTLILTRDLESFPNPERQEAERCLVGILCCQARIMLKSPLVQHFQVVSRDQDDVFRVASRDLDWEDDLDLYDETLAWADKIQEAFEGWNPAHQERCGFCKWILCPDRRAGNPLWSLVES